MRSVQSLVIAEADLLDVREFGISVQVYSTKETIVEPGVSYDLLHPTKRAPVPCPYSQARGRVTPITVDHVPFRFYNRDEMLDLAIERLKTLRVVA